MSARWLTFLGQSFKGQFINALKLGYLRDKIYCQRKNKDNSTPCLKFEDIFCFCVENLCGHQTIGWLVKFRGRTFESFFDINMRCIKILILVLVWQSTKKHICIVSDKISEIDKHVVSWIVLLWLNDIMLHLIFICK